MNEVVLGIDSSTQSTKVVAVELSNGHIVGEGRAPHSGRDIQWPGDWWEALRVALGPIVDAGWAVAGLSVAGQQHGFVAADATGEPVRPAPLWNNVEAAEDAERLNHQADFAVEIGTRLVSSITIAKVAHLARTNPGQLATIDAICLPHDWLTWKLTGNLVSDRGEASGSGWWSPIAESPKRHLLELAAGVAFASRVRIPDVLGPNDRAGVLTPRGGSVPWIARRASRSVLVPETTWAPRWASARLPAISWSVWERVERPTRFQTNRPQIQPEKSAGSRMRRAAYLPLACMLNCTRVVDDVARLTGMSLSEALDRAGAVEPGAGGLLLTPYLGGERTPNLPHATGSLLGIDMKNLVAGAPGARRGRWRCGGTRVLPGSVAPARHRRAGDRARRRRQRAPNLATGHR